MFDGFTTFEFTHDGATRTVYRRGEGPGVIVMHEIPGITPEVARFAGWVADAGLTAIMPDMFGTPGKSASLGYVARQMIGACISREFHVLASHSSSPITEWLRALCRHAHRELGGPGVGAVGMCLTGNFALSLMVDPVLMAPVLSQPSLPFPLGAKRRASLHLSADDLAVVKKRVGEGCKVLGLRFTKDPLSPPERFDALRRELGDGFESIEIDSKHGNPESPSPTPHSCLTNDLVDEAGHPTREACDRVLAFFSERLHTA